ncbi:Alpha/Beta hydrolase protein [Polychytrium aggregatum]|uniref:Alpha/Beta hydrolase protein n=1 Tax=Polychytrium aggregatum TaxID=110093 RepID=UPI0022FF04EF|nr:Alpha/Beta hydrolase protein [Polychytrium aggregatum]KAI9209501.1 Alpha/Beta hydrolase protein [Polychytrium aggregatum]
MSIVDIETGMFGSIAASLVYPAAAILALLWIYMQIVRSPVVLTHAHETIHIPIVDPDTHRIRRMPLSEFVKKHCPGLYGPKAVYHPTLWLSNGHLQTIFTSFYNDKMKNANYFNNGFRYERDHLQLPDGGNIALDWCPGPNRHPFDETPIVVILHGLTGGSHESYIKDLVREVTKGPQYYRCVVVNFRGCAGTKLTTSQLYCAAYTGDIKFALDYIRRKCPESPLIGIGFSLGANIILKAVGEMGSDCPFIAAISVGNPYDLLISSRALHRSLVGKIYSAAMTVSLKSLFRSHIDAIKDQELIDPDHVLKARRITDFDDRATRIAFRYRTVDEYYRLGSSAPHIPNVRVPLLCLHAIDDPIAHKEALPYHEIRSNPYAILATTQQGGHLGWWSGNFTIKRWFPGPVHEFITAMFETYLSLPPDLQKTFATPIGLSAPLVPSRAILPFSTPIDPHIIHKEIHATSFGESDNDLSDSEVELESVPDPNTHTHTNNNTDGTATPVPDPTSAGASRSHPTQPAQPVPASQLLRPTPALHRAVSRQSSATHIYALFLIKKLVETIRYKGIVVVLLSWFFGYYMGKSRRLLN